MMSDVLMSDVLMYDLSGGKSNIQHPKKKGKKGVENLT